MRVLRGFSGIIAGGVVALALVAVGAAVLGAWRGFPGPGTTAVTWHILAAVAVFVAQLMADRTRGVLAFCASMVVFSTAVLLLWTQWWY